MTEESTFETRTINLSLYKLVEHYLGNHLNTYKDGKVFRRRAIYDIRRSQRHADVVVIDTVEVVGKEKMKELRKEEKERKK